MPVVVEQSALSHFLAMFKLGEKNISPSSGPDESQYDVMVR